jgi:hypothetical protein
MLIIIGYETPPCLPMKQLYSCLFMPNSLKVNALPPTVLNAFHPRSIPFHSDGHKSFVNWHSRFVSFMVWVPVC